ncbi:MAG TPA: hypothetical protein VGD56_01720 [Gemmatirosa sp.]
MEARSIPFPIAAPRTQARAIGLPWPLTATLFAATSIAVGIIWDISWHMSIGRDTFWTPAHMAVYLGGIVGGLANAWRIFHATWWGDAAERGRTVRVWGFRGPLGAFVSCWGAGAMLVSAPFDNWWHDAYGLDVEILSPPHTVLLLGIVGIVLGAMLTSIAYQNAAEAGEYPAERLPAFRMAYAYAAAIALTMASIGTYEYTRPWGMHSGRFLRATSWIFPLHLVAVARASRLRWPATIVALLYMAVFAAMSWILPLFPATPRLGPIYYPVTHMVPLGFPLLLVFPALAIDAIVRRWSSVVVGRRAWLLAALLGITFVGVMAVVHWPLGSFLLSPASRNWFFAGDAHGYFTRPESLSLRGIFPPIEKSAAEYSARVGWALVVATVSSRIGIAWGGWLARVRR